MRQPKNGFILLINFNEVVHIESTGFKCLLKNLESAVLMYVGSQNRHVQCKINITSNVRPLNGTDVI